MLGISLGDETVDIEILMPQNEPFIQHTDKVYGTRSSQTMGAVHD